MPLYTDAETLMGDIFEHATFTRHEIIEALDPVARTIGYSCSECTGEDTIWEIPLTALIDPMMADAERIAEGLTIEEARRRTQAATNGESVNQVLRSYAGRAEFLRMVNQDAANPMFETTYSGPTVPMAPGEEVERLQVVHETGEVNADELRAAEEESRVRLHRWRTNRFDRREPV